LLYELSHRQPKANKVLKKTQMRNSRRGMASYLSLHKQCGGKAANIQH
jgi:hypothetical protein